MCPPTNHGASPWWCGNSTAATPCQDIGNSTGEFVTYTGGTVLGLPPVTSSSLSTSATAADARTTPNSNSPAITSAVSSEQTTSAQAGASTASSINKPSLQTRPNYATAVGAGIGVPLGIAAMGCLAFFFWREGRRNHLLEPPQIDAGIYPASKVAKRFSDRRGELPGSQALGELDHGVGKVELSCG